MTRHAKDGVADFLIDGNEAADLLEDAFGRLEERPADGKALEQASDACRRLMLRAGPLGQKRVVELAKGVARRLSEARSGKRPLKGGEGAALLEAGEAIREILERIESGL